MTAIDAAGRKYGICLRRHGCQCSQTRNEQRSLDSVQFSNDVITMGLKL